MAGTALEFGDVFVENMGVLQNGRAKLGDSVIQFKNEKTGKLTTYNSADVSGVNWQRLGNRPGVKIDFNDGEKLRIGGFKENDLEKIKALTSKHWNTEMTQNELVLKGWNYGDCKVEGKSVTFSSDGRPVFEVPLSNVANCVVNKSEASLEFHLNTDNPMSLSEMRFHMPGNPEAEDDDYNPVEEFRKAVMSFAGIETESGQPVASLSQILCTTPRGRYDIKVFPNHLSLHGKTYDYKIPIKTIMRLFLVPHKDGRHVFFVISLNPPIRQGQTRYHYLVLEFLKEDEIELELGLTDQQLTEQYGGKLERAMAGTLYEVVSKIFRVLINMKITVPGNFIGHSGTPAVLCAHKQASGFLYPLEKGFLYIHKPPMYIRFEEIASVHFARSDVSTRSFDFEIELKSGPELVFNSVEKDEYTKLYDYVQTKHLRIRNAKKMDKGYAEDRFAGSDDEIDHYKETVKAEGKEREADDDDSSDSEDDDYDLDADLHKRRKEREGNSSEGSASEPDEEFDSDADSADGSGSGEDEPSDEDSRPKKSKKEKSAKKVKEPTEKKPRASKKEKKEKDPNAPKRAQSAYFLWLNDNRSTIKKDGDSVTDTAKRAGEMWKTLEAAAKKPYEDKAQREKERYETAMKEYKKSGGGAAFAASSSKGKEKSDKHKSPKKSSGPSPGKAKSREYITDSDDSDDDKPLKPKKKESSEEEEADSD